MPEATASDVREVIDTHLEDPDLTDLIARVERAWQREYDTSDFSDAQQIADFEAALTALRVAEGRDRRAESEQSGRTSTTYETSAVDALRTQVRRLDPGGAFGRASTLVRDADRHTTTPSS